MKNFLTLLLFSFLFIGCGPEQSSNQTPDPDEVGKKATKREAGNANGNRMENGNDKQYASDLIDFHAILNSSIFSFHLTNLFPFLSLLLFGLVTYNPYPINSLTWKPQGFY